LDCEGILRRYFDGAQFAMVLTHGRAVASFAVAIAERLGLPDDETCFIEQAALLHDIGICEVRATEIGLFGEHPYIMHGVIGRRILETEGLPRHALVCERHIGVGVTVDDILSQELPLPLRDMTPQHISEKVICFADLFYSKKPGRLEERKSMDKVRKGLSRFGHAKLQIFEKWGECFLGGAEW